MSKEIERGRMEEVIELANKPVGFERVPRKGNRFIWSAFVDNQEQLFEIIEEEARIFLNRMGANSHNFSRENAPKLSYAIKTFYPGGAVRLKENIGLGDTQKPYGYWTPERIERESRIFIQEGGVLTQKGMRGKKGGLLSAIRRRYPGAIMGLKQKLGVEPSQRPTGYWNPDFIESRARQIYEAEGTISKRILSERGDSVLLNAISNHYPGGLNALKKVLGIQYIEQRPMGYWQNNQAKIEEEARNVFEQYGAISQKILSEIEKDYLIAAISNHYPGGFLALKRKLGLGVPKPANYWTPETIEKEALACIERHGYFSRLLIIAGGVKGFDRIVWKIYPGGMKALKEKLGIVEYGLETPVPSGQANEQLAKLMEAGNG